MRILLSAFAFAPGVGSEPGVGWRWAVELGRSHEVVVVTDVSRRDAVEGWSEPLPPGVRVVYYRPVLTRRIRLSPLTAQMTYSSWQYGVLGICRELHLERPFDVAIHLTYGVFRHPSFLGKLGIPFIFGPLGGGEDAPFRLKRSLGARELAKEIARSLVNKMALVNPMLWLSLQKSTAILVKTAETKGALPWPFRARAVVFPEIGVDCDGERQPSVRPPGSPLKVLFVGRLLGWKGVHLAIRAVAEAVGRGSDLQFTIVGSGPYEDVLRRLAAGLGLSERIGWIPRLSQADLFELYGSMHCLLFPSLHDSSGNVVLEAQANGLPVVCLDLGGPATLVGPGAGVVVPVGRRNEVGVVTSLATALCRLDADEVGRQSMAQAALSWTRTAMTWRSRAEGALGLVGLPDGADDGRPVVGS